MIQSDYPLQFKRMQFPVKTCSDITINKSQRHTLKITGIDIREDCFSYGQINVASSRVSTTTSLVIWPQQEIHVYIHYS